jgi:vacuolar-type H+-ATPase subunit F/Vma7
MSFEDLIQQLKNESLVEDIKQDEKFLYVYNIWTSNAFLINLADKDKIKSLHKHLQQLRTFKNQLISEDSDFLRSHILEYQELLSQGYEDVTSEKQENASKIALKNCKNNNIYVVFVKKDMTLSKKYITIVEEIRNSNNFGCFLKISSDKILEGVKEALNKIKDLENV